jgi:hypothetical protein
MTKKEEEPKEEPVLAEPEARRVRLPGWLVKEEIGLGDVVKRVAYRTGIKHCAGCDRRAAALNRWITFSRR